MKWDGDQTLTYDNGARVAIRMPPWKLVDGEVSYGTTITEDLGFGAGDTIADGGEAEGSVNDNTSDLYWGITSGIFELTADANSTDGTAYLYIEESDDNSTWPSDQADFAITDLGPPVAILPLSTDAEDEDRAVNFHYGARL